MKDEDRCGDRLHEVRLLITFVEPKLDDPHASGLEFRRRVP